MRSLLPSFFLLVLLHTECNKPTDTSASLDETTLGDDPAAVALSLDMRANSNRLIPDLN